MGVRRIIVRAALGAALAVGLLPVSSVNAAGPPTDGSFDTSFDTDGSVDRTIADYPYIERSIRQPDGKLVLAGRLNVGFDNDVLVVRLTTSGTFDTTFGGGDGWVTTRIGSNATAYGVTLQSDGRIVVAGIGNDGGSVAFLARYTTAGVLDTTFGGDGIVTLPVGSDNEFTGVAIQPDGRIVAAGTIWSPNRILVARFTSSGALDTTFNGTGSRTFDGLGEAQEPQIVVQPDGKIVFAGITHPTPSDPTSLEVFRVTSTGSPDSSFNGDGTSVLDPGTSDNPSLRQLLLAPDGDITVIGAADQSVVVSRLQSSGLSEDGFGSGGYVVQDLGGYHLEATAAAFEPNGRLVVAGERETNESETDMFVLRLLPMGVLDPTFGHMGTVTTDLAQDFVTPTSVGIGTDGRITIGIHGQASPNRFGAVRLMGDTVAPFGARVTNLPAVATAKTRTLNWTASDDNTGVSKFDVRYRSARWDASALGAATTLKSATTAPYGAVSWSAGRTYCYEVRGRDGAGNVGLYGTQSCVVVPLDDRSMTRSGSWTSPTSSKYYLGTASRSTSSGATLKRTGAKYRRLALVATTCSTCGTAKVYLGSTLLKTVSLKSSTTKRKVVIPIDVSASVRSGTITVKQASGGKPVIIEGLAIGLY